MRWAVEIQKTGLERRNLSDLLVGLGLNLVEGIEYPALTSAEIDACVSAKDAFEKAKAVEAAFTGPARVDPDFELGSVINYSTNPPSRLAFLEAKSCLVTVAQGFLTPSVSQPEGLSPAELERWTADHEESQYQAQLERQRSKLEPAFFSPRAAKLIELLAIDSPSGEIIYKVYELVEGNAKERAEFHRRFEIAREQFDRFKDAVHNPTVTGDWARHAHPQKLNSSNPMTKSEAEAFARDIAAKWLETLRRRI